MNRSTTRLAGVIAALLLSTAGAAETVATDTSRETPSGLVYTQPADWTLSESDGMTLVTAPEGDLDLAIVDVGEAEDAGAAAAAAWNRYDQDADRAVRVTVPEAAPTGWEEAVSLSYETAPAEGLVVSALALRRGEEWTVLIVRGARTTADKRSAALSLLEGTLRPSGVAVENFADQTPNALTPERIETLRRFVQEAAATLDVPGVGLALIENGEVVYQGGVGIRALDDKREVTERTKFMVASNTKGMSTLLLSVLADEGRLDWDQKVVDLYPDFRLGDEETTNSVLVRHLVCACTGLPRQDWAFILADQGLPEEDTFRQLSETFPTSSFGALFQYNNLMTAAAGYLGGALAYPDRPVGAAYDRAMRTRIFRPLRMRDTTFDFDRGMRGNWAKPHGLDIAGEMTLMSNRFNYTVYPYRPAGGVFSTTADMARFVQLELSKGLTPEGKRLVSEENLLERREKGVQVADGVWYGMGLFNETRWGLNVVTHGGTLSGYHSNWYALPEIGVGAVVLTNADTGAALLRPFLRRLVEVLYDADPKAAEEIAAAAGRFDAQGAARATDLTLPPDPAVIANLAERYVYPPVGDIELFTKEGSPWLRAGSIEAPVATRRNADGTVSLVTVGPGLIQLDALIGERDGARTLTVQDAQDEYVYEEAPQPE